MPVTEADVAITEFLTKHDTIHAIVKQNLDDFIVTEVLQDGRLATLTNLPTTQPSTSTYPKCTPTATNSSSNHSDAPANANAPDKHPPPSDEQLAQLDAFFTPDRDAPSLAVRALLADGDGNRQIQLPPCADKSVRTSVHQWVRNYLPAFTSETIDGAIHIVPNSSFHSRKRRRIDYRSKTTKPPSNNPTIPYVPRGASVRFILWKRGLDTNQAIAMLSRTLRTKPKSFSYAGTKDKRAVTSQLVQTRNVPPSALATVNARLRRHRDGKPHLLIGNLEAVRSNRPLNLGDLRGNRFTIVLREANLTDDAATQRLSAAVSAVAEHGFVNYFGLQRFGSGVSPTHATGFAVLRNDYEDVCRRLLLPLHLSLEAGDSIREERTRMTTALSLFSQRKITARELLDDLPPRMVVERTIAEAFAHDEQRGNGTSYDYRAAFGKLSRNLRKMYPHAVQSYLWNLMASERIRLYRPDCEERMHAIAGDIVLSEEEENKDDLHSDCRVHVVTTEEEKECKYSVFRVVIPVVGAAVEVPEAAYGDVARKVIEEEKLVFSMQLAQELNIGGAYRRLLAKPEDVELRVETYTDKHVPLAPIGIEHLDAIFQKKDSKDAESAKGSGQEDIEGGDENHNTKNPEGTPGKHEHGVVGDTVKQEIEGEHASSNIDKGREKESQNCSGVGERGTANEGKSVEHLDASTDAELAKEPQKAVVLSFTLGCSEYATMMIREVTKQDSSTAGQKLLQKNKAS